jgi:putative FmdB family regulatory protein
MPLYEYRCRGCGHEFEALVRTGDIPACPACRSGDLEQLLSMFAVSSEGTRQSNLQSARRQNAKTQRDKAIADREEMEHHHH